MGSDSQYAAPRLHQLGTPPSTTMIEEIMDLHDTGRWDQLEIKARTAAGCHPGHILGWLALSKALLKQGKWEESMGPLARTSQLSPCDADVQNDLGFALCNLGRVAEAEASYRLAMRYHPGFARAYNNLGVLLSDQGRFSEAAVHLRLALKINPDAAETHCNLGCALRNLGWLDDSEASYRRALELNPDSDLALHGLGKLLELVGGRDDEAISCLERSISLSPNAADACITLGNILMRTGQVAGAVARYRRAQELRPLFTRRAAREKAAFSVVLLDALGPGNTPISYLAGRAPYDCHYFCVIPDAPLDLDLLRAKADVVVNLIGDADSGKDILPAVQDLVERLGRPTVNHPGLIGGTSREAVARRLAGIPLCRIPRTVRLAGPQLTKAARDSSLDGYSLPLLVRLAGNHGGDDFEKLSDANAVADFVSGRPEADYYLTEYVDYRSADGFFRKYRLICIDGELFPYHLAIHDDWKVHHLRTDMANRAWMRREEESFLEAPLRVFDGPRQAALLTVAATSGLHFSGIDCALDRSGEIVVFEANATMLVHDEKEQIYAYKNPYIARIKEAFDAMLSRMATGGWSQLSGYLAGGDPDGTAPETPGGVIPTRKRSCLQNY